MASIVIKSTFRAARPSFLRDPANFLQICRLRSAALRQTNTRNAGSLDTRRGFNTTRIASATVVSQNPRLDEDGNEMLITISDRAAKRLKKITSTPPPKNTLAPSSSSSPDSHLRVTVTSGGCHGFQYLMSLEPADKLDAEEDTVFTFVDNAANQGEAKVVLDEPSLELLKGSTVDFTTELIGSQFKIVGNPRATSSCGCGTSFDIE